MTRRSILHALAGLSALLAAGCARDDAVPPPKHSVSYVLEWKKAKVEEAAGTSGWELTNDLGYRVRLTRGYLVTRSLELIPCNPVPPQVSLLRKLGDFIGPRPAYAGHSTIADPSATKNAEVESLLSPRTRAAVTLYPGAQKYCQAHYLIARADPSASGLPAEVDMVDQSLHLEGWARRAGESQQIPFTVITSLANGKLFDLPQSQDGSALNTGETSGVVVIRRDLDSVFDHVDFDHMDPKRIGREVLANLINGTEVELTVKQEPSDS